MEKNKNEEFEFKGLESHKIQHGKSYEEFVESLSRLIKEQILDLSEKIKTLYKLLQTLESTGETGVLSYSSVYNHDNPKFLKHNYSHSDSENEYSGYPINGDFLEKITFLENKINKFWKMNQMKDIMRKAERDSWSANHEENFRKWLNDNVKKGKIKQLMFNNAKKHCYYGTRDEWIETLEVHGEKFHKIKIEHMPDAKFLKSLSEEQLDIKKIKWNGI